MFLFTCKYFSKNINVNLLKWRRTIQLKSFFFFVKMNNFSSSSISKHHEFKLIRNSKFIEIFKNLSNVFHPTTMKTRNWNINIDVSRRTNRTISSWIQISWWPSSSSILVRAQGRNARRRGMETDESWKGRGMEDDVPGCNMVAVTGTIPLLSHHDHGLVPPHNAPYTLQFMRRNVLNTILSPTTRAFLAARMRTPRNRRRSLYIKGNILNAVHLHCKYTAPTILFLRIEQSWQNRVEEPRMQIKRASFRSCSLIFVLAFFFASPSLSLFFLLVSSVTVGKINWNVTSGVDVEEFYFRSPR